MKGAFAIDAPPSGSKHSAFGTFLRTLRQADVAAETARGASRSPYRAAPTPDTKAVSRQVFSYLGDHGAAPVSQVLTALDIGILDFAEVLPGLVDTGLVEVRRTPEGEVLALTELGTRVELLLDPSAL